MPNSKNENQDKNLENEDLKKETAESKPKKTTEKNTQKPKTTSQTQKDNKTTSEKKPVQKKSASADKKTADKESTPADKKPAQKKPAAAGKKAAAKKDSVVKENAEEPKQAKSAKAAKPAEAKKAEVKEEVKEAVVLEEVKIEDGENTEEDVLIELFSDKDNEEIDEELETIKNIIQEDVNKIIEDSNGAEWSEIVKQSKEEKNEDEDEPNSEEDLTKVKSEEPTKYNYLSYFAVALFIIALIAIIFLTVINWKPMSYIIKADNFESSHKLTSAVIQYDKAISQIKDDKDQVTKRLIGREIKDYYKMGAQESFDLINKYYTKKDLKCFLYNDISKINKEYTLLQNTGKIIDASSTISNYKDFVNKLDKDYKKSPDKYDSSCIEYYKFLMAGQLKESTQTQLKDLKKAESLTTSPFLLVHYYAEFSNFYLKAKDYDKVLSYTDKSLSINQDDTTSYLMRAKVYRLQKNYNNAIKECDKGINVDSSDYGLYQNKAIALILQGKYKLAEDSAEKSYSNAYTAYNSGYGTISEDQFNSCIDIYALCAYLNNDKSTYEQIKNNKKIAEDIASIISKSKTAEDVFLDKDGAY